MKLIDDSSEPRNVEVVRHGEGNALPQGEFTLDVLRPSAPHERSEWVHFGELTSALSRRKTLVVLSMFLRRGRGRGVSPSGLSLSTAPVHPWKCRG